MAGAEPGAGEFVPPDADLERLREAAADCQGCRLYRDATQTVFGEGNPSGRIVLVGEQPGDREDREGEPFVGPAGGLLDKALAEAGIDRSRCYVTNAVKHFKWEARGPRRLHKKPSSREVAACRPWLEAELSVIRPELVVCLGATAAQSLLGPSFRVTQHRGEVIDRQGLKVTATVHPSSILRADPDSRQEQMEAFVSDLRQAGSVLSRG